MRLAQIVDGKVANVSLASGGQEVPDGWVQSEVAQIGWSFIDGQFIAPEQPASVPTKEEQQENRAALYAKEADPLFFKAQRGEATMEDWLAKIAEIKARFPDP